MSCFVHGPGYMTTGGCSLCMTQVFQPHCASCGEPQGCHKAGCSLGPTQVWKQRCAVCNAYEGAPHKEGCVPFRMASLSAVPPAEVVSVEGTCVFCETPLRAEDVPEAPRPTSGFGMIKGSFDQNYRRTILCPNCGLMYAHMPVKKTT